jgi:hypothetical protein
MPVPETNGEEWDRLEPLSALDALVELAVHGEYSGTETAKRTRDSLELRTVALNIFKVSLFISNVTERSFKSFVRALFARRRLV